MGGVPATVVVGAWRAALSVAEMQTPSWVVDKSTAWLCVQRVCAVVASRTWGATFEIRKRVPWWVAMTEWWKRGPLSYVWRTVCGNRVVGVDGVHECSDGWPLTGVCHAAHTHTYLRRGAKHGRSVHRRSWHSLCSSAGEGGELRAAAQHWSVGQTLWSVPAHGTLPAGEG